MNSWKRKEHFQFFSGFDEPFFGIVAEIDCTRAIEHASVNRYSFFASYLHKSLLAANLTEEFRYRIENNEVVVYDEINASPTIGRSDDTFSFSFVRFDKNFQAFSSPLSAEITRIQATSGLGLNNEHRNDVIHYSSIPWIRFTGITHARHFKAVDSIPKISFGKAVSLNGKVTMPVSVNVHHGLMDGLQVSRFLDLFQDLMNNLIY